MVVSCAINTKEKDFSQRQLWLLPNSKKKKIPQFSVLKTYGEHPFNFMKAQTVQNYPQNPLLLLK